MIINYRKKDEKMRLSLKNNGLYINKKGHIFKKGIYELSNRKLKS